MIIKVVSIGDLRYVVEQEHLAEFVGVKEREVLETGPVPHKRFPDGIEKAGPGI
jgi:hypothetical protein